jgi:hypothetical protein
VFITRFLRLRRGLDLAALPMSGFTVASRSALFGCRGEDCLGRGFFLGFLSQVEKVVAVFIAGTANAPFNRPAFFVPLEALTEHVELGSFAPKAKLGGRQLFQLVRRRVESKVGIGRG